MGNSFKGKKFEEVCSTRVTTSEGKKQAVRDFRRKGLLYGGRAEAKGLSPVVKVEKHAEAPSREITKGSKKGLGCPKYQWGADYNGL